MNTTTRWTSAVLPLRSASLALAALLWAATAAHADAIRSFPDAALRGQLEVTTPPVVQLDGKADQLSMGARIRDTRNLLVTSATLANGQAHVVNYTRDPQGQINEVWLLTDEEAALRRASASPSWYQRWFGL